MTTGYKYELTLVLNGTVPLLDLTQLEQQVFKAFHTPSQPHTFTLSPITSRSSQNSTSTSSSLSSTKKKFTPITKQATPNSKQATPLSPFKTPPTYGSPRALAARDRGTKDHFNYLLLDPRVLERLSPTDDSNSTGDGNKSDLEKFRVFVESIFYVGKGKNSRSMQHLKDAKDSLNLQKSKVGEDNACLCTCNRKLDIHCYVVVIGEVN